MQNSTRNACVVSIAFFMFIFQGCTAEIKNHTPSQFPWTVIEDWPTDVLYASSTEEIVNLGVDSAHRFVLEIKPRNVTDITAFVTVNGTEHQMAELSGTSGSGLHTFESPDECNTEYNYHYRVRYRRGWYGWSTKTLGTEQDPLHVAVDGSGDVIWRTPAGNVHPSTEPGYPELGFVQRSNLEHTIIIQNLREDPISLYGIGLNDDFVGANNEEFEVFDVPIAASGFPLPPAESFILACGESLRFRVQWNGQTVGVVGALSMHASGAGFQMNRVLLLKGLPHPG